MAVFDPHGLCWPFAKSSLLGAKFRVPFFKKNSKGMNVSDVLRLRFLLKYNKEETRNEFNN